MAERGRFYLWPHNRSYGDSKARNVGVHANQLKESSRRVLPRSSSRLICTARSPGGAD